MDDPPESLNILLQTHAAQGGDSLGLFLGLTVLVLMLVSSALISGAEVAYFSLSRSQLAGMEASKARYRQMVLELMNRPKMLLATILIVNNFVNVGIVILSTYLIARNVPPERLNMLVAGIIPVGRLIEVFGITAIVLFFGEIIPKVYANQNAEGFASFMSYPLYYLTRSLAFLSIPMIRMTGVIDRKAKAVRGQISVDDLSHALDLTKAETLREKEDREILEGIVRFGNTDVKQIMKPRTDMEAVEASAPYRELLNSLLDSGFSRMPIYEGSLDHIRGIIHVKDLLPHMDEADDFGWPHLMRDPFFVPESKMIDDLLDEFQQKKVHMAIVVDEYGGCEGLVTLEDVIEEIVGDISDEFDEDEVVYSRLDDRNYVFEGKIPLKQFYRVMKIGGDEFEAQKGESDTLAGFILELAGRMPAKGQSMGFGDFEFVVESVDKRRVKRIKVIRVAEDVKDASPGMGKQAVVLMLLSFGLLSCGQDYTPKPQGYMRIDLPRKEYRPVHTDCPFSFETAVYSNFVPDTVGDAEPCWFNIEYPQFKAKLHFSYKTVSGNLADYMEQSRELTNKHLSKATAIDDSLILRYDARVFGTFYTVDGSQAASPFQFFLTDSTDHFLRAALYFNAVPNNDSLKPVIGFLRKDALHIIRTLEWK